MRRIIRLLVCVAVLTSPGRAGAQTATQEINDKLTELPDGTIEHILASSASLAHREAAKEVLARTLQKRYSSAINLDSPDFVCLIHVMRWADPSGSDSSQSPESQNWYVYSGDKDWDQTQFTTAKRLFGTKNVWLVYIHLNRATTATQYTPSYEVLVTKKAPTNVTNILQLAKLFPGGGAIPGDVQFAVDTDAAAKNLWGGNKITVIAGLPADIKVTPKAKTVVKLTGTSNGQSVTVDNDKVNPLGDAITFDNEGKSHWDVSVGFPFGGINDLKFDDATHQATNKTIDKSNVFALLHLYVPYAVDLKSKQPFFFPRPIIGVDISDRPLNKVLVGGAVGTPFATFFMAGAWTKIKDENGEFTDKREWQFVTGVSFPVTGATKLLKGDK